MLRRRQVVAQPIGFVPQCLLLLAQTSQPGDNPLLLGCAALDRAAQSNQLASHLGRLTARSRHTLAPLLLERVALGGQCRFRLDERRRFRCQGLGFAFDLHELTAQSRRLGLEGCDHALIDEGVPFAFNAPQPLGEQCAQTPRALVQRLETCQRVTEVIATHGRELGFGAHHPGVEIGQPTLELAVGLLHVSALRSSVVELALERLELATGDEHSEVGQLGDETAVASRRFRLTLEGTELPAHLAQQILQPQQIAFGGLQAALRLLLALAVLEYARGLFDDQPPLFGPRVEHRVDLALADDHVLLPADAAVGQELLDVEQTTRRAVDGVLAVPRAEQRARDRHLVELDRQHSRRVVDGEADLGPAQRLAIGGAGEDDVVHLLRTHCARCLRAEHPGDGVDDVRLAASVGADDDRHPRFQIERCALGEGLEALQIERLQVHMCSGFGLDSAGLVDPSGCPVTSGSWSRSPKPGRENDAIWPKRRQFGSGGRQTWHTSQ